MEMKALSEDPPLGSLVPYYMENKDDKGVVLEPWCFNNSTQWGNYSKLAEKAVNADPFRLNDDADKERRIPIRYGKCY